jgi:hypothetical protein
MLTAIENTAFGIWVRESGSMWSYPMIITFHAWGMAMLAGLSAVIDLRILGRDGRRGYRDGALLQVGRAIRMSRAADRLLPGDDAPCHFCRDPHIIAAPEACRRLSFRRRG